MVRNHLKRTSNWTKPLFPQTELNRNRTIKKNLNLNQTKPFKPLSRYAPVSWFRSVQTEQLPIATRSQNERQAKWKEKKREVLDEQSTLPNFLKFVYPKEILNVPLINLRNRPFKNLQVPKHTLCFTCRHTIFNYTYTIK